jgi:hypothetical protein
MNSLAEAHAHPRGALDGQLLRQHLVSRMTRSRADGSDIGRDVRRVLRSIAIM